MSMTPIFHTKLSSQATSIDFTAIPQTYTHLYLVISSRHTNTIIDGQLYINGSGGTRTATYAQTNGTPTSATGALIGVFGNRSSQVANSFANSTVLIMNYTEAREHRISVETVEVGNGSAVFLAFAGNYTTSTAAVTSISISGTSGANIAAGSSATLYGITAGSDGTTTVS